jgi:hypothetical protein
VIEGFAGNGSGIEGADARSLEVVRCRAYEAGAQEPARKDGSRQLRLPLGAWIVGLRTAEELARERARDAAG